MPCKGFSRDMWFLVSEREGFQRALEVFRGFYMQRFSEIFQRFSEVLSETLSEADFPLRDSQSLFPLIVLPLQLSPIQGPKFPSYGVRACFTRSSLLIK